MHTSILGRESLNAEQDSAADQLIQMVEEWMVLMLLDRWELTVTFKPGLKEGETEEDATRTWADTATSWFYQTIHITFYSRSMERIKTLPELVEHVIIHELSHSLVKPMEKENPSTREDERTEFVVTNLERVLFGLKYRNTQGVSNGRA